MIDDRHRMTSVEQVIADARAGTWLGHRRAQRLTRGLDAICNGRSLTAARIRREVGPVKL